MAVPTPPPTTATVPKRSTSEGWPRGPTTSSRASPTSRLLSSFVVLPIPWTMRVIVPASGSLPAMVRGMRSPCSWRRTMTNWPAWRLRAMRGAVRRKSLTCGARNRASTIGNIGSGLDELRLADVIGRHFEHRRLHDVALDGALVRGAHDGVPILFREAFGQVNVDPHRADAGAAGVLLGGEGQLQAVRINSALLAEAQGIESGAGSQRGEEQLERLGSRARSAVVSALISVDPQAVEVRVYRDSAWK